MTFAWLVLNSRMKKKFQISIGYSVVGHVSEILSILMQPLCYLKEEKLIYERFGVVSI